MQMHIYSFSIFVLVRQSHERTAIFYYPRIRSLYVPLYLIQSISISYKRKNLFFLVELLNTVAD